MTLTTDDINLLKLTAEATQQNGVVYKTPAQMTALATAGLVEGNAAFVDPAQPGAIAFRATPTGLTAAQNYAAAASTPPAAAPVAAAAPVPGQPPVATPAPASVPVQAHQTGSGFVLPEKVLRRPSNNVRTYNFESLNIGDWIFVPATEKKKDPKKSLASTISGANKRYENFSPRRYFKAVRAIAGQQFGSVTAPSNGAYIVRVEPPEEAPAAEAKATA